MKLNTLSPAEGSKKNRTRVGRGIGCTKGKTCGKGHKGLKARSGGKVRAGFEGGQMPLYMRLPKFGFTSRKQLCTESLPVGILSKLAGDVTLETLLDANLIKNTTKHVKFYASGELTSKVNVKGIPVTKGAREIIVKASGTVE